jgi:hypothetical protein
VSEATTAMDGVELAIRRISARLKRRTPWDMGVTDALDELADEIGNISAGAKQVEAFPPADRQTPPETQHQGTPKV